MAEGPWRVSSLTCIGPQCNKKIYDISQPCGRLQRTLQCKACTYHHYSLVDHPFTLHPSFPSCTHHRQVAKYLAHTSITPWSTTPSPSTPPSPTSPSPTSPPMSPWRRRCLFSFLESFKEGFNLSLLIHLLRLQLLIFSGADLPAWLTY